MATTKIPLQTIIQAGHSEQILSIAISPDSQYLASTSGGDSAVKLWDLQNGVLIRNFTGHTGWVLSVVFSSDGKYLLTGGWDFRAKLWDVLTGECLQTYQAGHVNAVCFTPDNKNVITAGSNYVTDKLVGSVYLWDLYNADPKQNFQYYPKLSFEGDQGHTDAVISVSISRNNKYLATGSKDGTVKLWDLRSAGLLKTFIHSKTAFVHTVVFDPVNDPQYIISGGSAEMHDVNPEIGKPQDLKLWDINGDNQNKAREILSGHSNNIYAAAISRDGRYLASCSEDTNICLWDLKTNEKNRLLYQFKGHEKALQAICFSSDGRFLAYGGVEEEVKLWDVGMKQEVRTFSGHTSIVFAAAMSPNGKYLVEGGEGNKINLWDLAANKGYESIYPELAKQNPNAEVRAIDISYDGKLLAVGINDKKNGYGGSIRIWDLEKNLHFKGCFCDQAVSSVRFSEDGKYLVAGCDLGDFCFWDLAKEEPDWTKQAYKSYWGTYVDVNMTKGYLVVAFDHILPNEPDLMLIDLNDKNERYFLTYTVEANFTRDRIRSVRMCKNGRYLVTAHHDQKTRLWDLENIKQVKCIREFIEPDHQWVSTADISNDGRYILSSSYDNTVRLRDAWSETNEPVQIFAGHTSEVFARFSPDEKYIITASKDCTSKIWDRNTGKVITTLVAIGDVDWAVLTPSGLFDASPGAMQKMHYVSGMEVIELDQLKGRYWEPNLLSIVMNFTKGELKDVDQLTALALYPEVISMEIKDNLLHVKLEKRSGGIGRTSLRINNKERERDINIDRKPEFSIDLKQYKKFLAAGENNIAIRCWNEADWLPGPLLDRVYIYTGKTEDGPPSMYAVFVGTSKYKNERFSLAYPDQDAGFMSDAVKIVGEQFFTNGRVNIRLLTTEDPLSSSFSNKSNIKAAFEEIAQKAKPQDVVVIYFSGHGASFDDGKKALYYYLTNELVSDNFSDSAIRTKAMISSEELSDWINAIPAMKQVLILDTCYSGKIVDTLKSKNATDATQEREMDRMKDRTGMYVLAGSAADKVSYESSAYGQGLLTYTLLMGMRGAALQKNTNQQVNSVDIMNLFTWSKDEVERLSKEFDVIQTPTLRPPAKVESFAIGIAGPEEQRKIKLAIPKPVFVHSNFMDRDDFLDGLNISEMLDQYLMGSIGIGNRPQAIFIDVNYFPGAQQVRGLYAKTQNGYVLTGKVYKDKELKGSFEIEGQGMEDLVPKIAREVENHAFPKDEYKVPEDDEIGVLEKGLKDDLEKIQGTALKAFMLGYHDDFIGERFKVSLPTLDPDHLDEIAYLLDPKTKAITKETVLKYQYYSTIHNKKRKFPFFAACNLNGAAFLSAGRNGVFVTDPRIAREDQCGDELYTYKYKGLAYTSFCHRGHMSKREDPQWADKANIEVYYKSDPPADTALETAKQDKAVLTSIAERGARLTFFFTNAIPQHGHLNGVVWRGLEDYIMAVATNNKKAEGPDLYKINIMTGPVFQDNDPVFPLADDTGKNSKSNGLKIPTLFWKVVYFTKTDGKLYHVGFLMGQEALLKAEFERLDGLQAKEAREKAEEPVPPFEGYKNKSVFQVKIAFIESLTKLTFHPAIDPYNDDRPAKEIIEKVQLVKKDIAGEAAGPGYLLDGLSI